MLDDEGLVSLRLDGQRRALIQGTCAWADGAPWLYLIYCGHSLYALDDGGERVRQLFEEVGSVDLAPDGRELAAVSPDGAHLVIMDLDTLQMRPLIDAPEGRQYTRVGYEEPWLVRVLWQQRNGKLDYHDHSVDVRVSDGAVVRRSQRSPSYRFSWGMGYERRLVSGCTDGHERCACAADWKLTVEGHTELVWSRPGERSRTIAEVIGREQRNWEYGPAPEIHDVFVSADCRAIGFHYAGNVYAVDVASGSVGLLAHGTTLRRLALRPTGNDPISQ